MPVTGVIVTCAEEDALEVGRRIGRHPRLEVREHTGGGLIVVTDTVSIEQDRADVEWIVGLDGVLATHVTFTNIEDVNEAAAVGSAAPATGRNLETGND